MNWLIFALAAYVVLALETGLRTLLGLPSPGAVSPSFVLILAIYIGMSAPREVVIWAWLILGLLAGLAPGPGSLGLLVAPMAIGYLAGAYALLQLRGLVFRESVISFAAMTLAVGLFVQLVIVTLLTLRGLPWPLGEVAANWSLADQLVHRFLGLLYTTALSVPLGFVLLRTKVLWGFGK